MKVTSKGIGSVPSLDKVFKSAKRNKTSEDRIKQREREAAEYRRMQMEIEMSKEPYTIITASDIINLFAEHNIPVARQTVAAIQKEKLFYIKGQLDVIRK